MKKNKIIPFKCLPSAWGLSGNVYKEAEACYYYDPGYELDVILANIKYEDDLYSLKKKLIEIDFKYKKINQIQRDINFLQIENPDEKSVEYLKKYTEILFKHNEIDELEKDRTFAKLDGCLTKQKELELSFKHGIIDEYAKDVSIANLIDDETEKTIALLEVDFKHGKLKKNVFEKRKATILEEPWIDIIDHGYDPKKGVNGVYFEFDWNEFWIEYLELNGYKGRTEEEIVQSWFYDVNNSLMDDKVLSMQDNEI